MVVAWGFGRYAPEASAGRPIALVNGLSFRQRRRGGLGPRPVHEETSASWFQADRPDPQAMEALCLYVEPSSRASNPPSLKGYH